MPARLITIRFSHYCEKARWGLDRFAVPYVEEAHPPLFSGLKAKRSGGRRTVPVLVTEDRVLSESDDILRYAESVGVGAPIFLGTKDHDELLDRLNQKLGPAVRRFAYFHILPEGDVVRELFQSSAAGFERTAIGVLRAPISALMRRGMKIDESGAARSWSVIERTFDEVAMLRKDGRRFLLGDTFSAADLTFAALAAPLLSPAAYVSTAVPEDRIPKALREISSKLQAHPAGAYGLELYARERHVRGVKAP